MQIYDKDSIARAYYVRINTERSRYEAIIKRTYKINIRHSSHRSFTVPPRVYVQLFWRVAIFRGAFCADGDNGGGYADKVAGVA